MKRSIAEDHSYIGAKPFMAIICFVGPPGKVGRCVNTNPVHVPAAATVKRSAPLAEKAEEEPGLYPEIFVDASILNGIHLAAKGVSDKGTRAALQRGIESALEALRKRGGNEISSITLED